MSAPQLIQRYTATFLLQRQLQHIYRHQRCFGNLPLVYDGEDPAPIYFAKPVQHMMRYLTRPDPAVVFKKKKEGAKSLSKPIYKFLTDEELKEEIEKARRKAYKLLKPPPVVKVYKEAERVISLDPALQGYDTCKYIFTDISFGITENSRTVVIREPDGKLKHAEYDIKKRLVQAYFPLKFRSMKDPAMYTDETLMNRLLDAKEYIFILDRSCIQYNPEEYTYQSVNAKVFQHVDMNMEYKMLRSTRHFGPMSFYYAWHNAIDGLMLELLESGAVREATVLISLHRFIHPKIVESDESQVLTEAIVKTRKFLDDIKSDGSDADIELDEQCFDCVNNYIQKNSMRKGKQELALQTAHELWKRQVEMDRGIKEAHGMA